MSFFEPTSSDSAPSFGYLPDPNRIDVPLGRTSFARALTLDIPVRSVVDEVPSCRILLNSGVALPEGVYWFEGIDEPIIVQVGVGAAAGPAMIAPLADIAEGHPLAAAFGWAEQLWGQAEEVPQPQFEINDVAVMQPGDTDVTVRGRKFPTQQWSYSVVGNGEQKDVLESQLRPRPQLDSPRAWVTQVPTPAGRFGATLTRAKLLGKFSNTLFSFRATRTTFRPYQFKPVLKLLQTGKAHLLIADEVGLGKTIEAGLIWTELEARQEADRVLVVCPSSLLTKWKEEMADRFGFELMELDSNGLKEFLDQHQRNRLQRRRAYICSLERLRMWEGLEVTKEIPPHFDLVIVDEAHSMRNQDTKSYALGTEIAEWADNLVFLTATPINLRQEDLLNLLELLAPGDYGDIRDLELRLEPNRITNSVAARLLQKGVRGRDLLDELNGLASTTLGGSVMSRPDFKLLAELLDKDELTPNDIVTAKRYLADLNTLSTAITRTKKVEVDDRKAKRSERRHEVVWTRLEENFYEEYLTWCRRRAAEMGRPLHFAMQMPLRLASACLPMARRAVLDPVGFGELSDADSNDASARLDPHPELIDAAKALPEGVDSKFDVLREVLKQLSQLGKRALLFTHSRPTLSYLNNRLGDEFRVAVMHGGVNRDQRRTIMADFRAGQYDFVFANRVASEGLDFEFCSAVINYDLPWNPMEIEQRIGRIDRIGQVEEAIMVVNFVNPITIDERILVRLLDRIQIFESSIGALEPIIALNAPKVLQTGLDFSLSAEQREQKLHEALTAIEEQRAGLKDVTDASSALMVSNDIDVAGLEDDLVRTGRYVGQRELALLLDDWAGIDGASGVRFSANGQTLDLFGNRAMAVRVNDLVRTNHRTGEEIRSISDRLRDELPVSLILDQELSRTGGGMLLTATSPLVIAAAEVPGHRQARFASLRLTTSDSDVTPGTYVAVLTTATSASRGGDEIWGCAVTLDGRNAGEGPVDALLAALAEGRLVDAPLPTGADLEKLADRAMDQLSFRHAREGADRAREFGALKEARRITLEEQHRRRVEAITNRINTATARDREERSIGLFRSQLRRAQERHDRLIAELESQPQPEIGLQPLAACVLQVIEEGA
jgi:SNF2 family DNA or RNA helicase